MSILSNITRNSQSQACDHTKNNHPDPKNQLSICGITPTDGHTPQQLGLVLSPPPSTQKRPDGFDWWNIWRSYSQKIFGQLYSISERDRILGIFSSTNLVASQECELVAERIISKTTQRQGVVK